MVLFFANRRTFSRYFRLSDTVPPTTRLAAPVLTVMRLRHPWRWAIGGLVAIVVSAAAFVYYRLNESLRRHYEPVGVIAMVDDYVRTHDGKWPSSWEDLEGTETFKRRGCGLAYFQRYTSVDFTLTSEQLIEKPGLIYHAVTPIDMDICDQQARQYLDRVLQAIRDARSRAGATTGSSSSAVGGGPIGRAGAMDKRGRG
jgi:hypothetical protein